MFNRHGLHDHASHRHTNSINNLAIESVNKPDGIGCHVRQGVRNLDRVTAKKRCVEDPLHVNGLSVEMAGQPNITVVKTNDMPPACCEFMAQSFIPAQ